MNKKIIKILWTKLQQKKIIKILWTEKNHKKLTYSIFAYIWTYKHVYSTIISPKNLLTEKNPTQLYEQINYTILTKKSMNYKKILKKSNKINYI